MLIYTFTLIISLVIILFSCELFTNSIEWLGKRLKVGDGVVGSLFSAVGTCLPETTIPIAAVFLSPNNANSSDISIGAIIGAPFMLGTLAFFVTGASVVIFAHKRGSGLKMFINSEIMGRDILFFMISYITGIFTSYTALQTVRVLVACTLVLIYVLYIFLTVKRDIGSAGNVRQLYFKKSFGVKSNRLSLILQIAIAFSGIILGAGLFVDSIGELSAGFGLSAMVLSLVIAPIATELPEKFNSIIWIRRNKDTLALGNITGAMVFQSCIPISFGILATRWTFDTKTLLSAILVLLSAATLYIWIRIKKMISPLPLLLGGVFYAVFICYIIKTGMG